MSAFFHASGPALARITRLLLVSFVSACTSWQVGSPTPAQLVEREHPNAVRVTRTDGTTLTLSAPAVRGDSLVGTVGVGLARDDGVSTASVALADVRQLEVRRADTGKTLLAIVGVGGTFLVVYFVVTLGSAISDCSDGCID